jgi:hypothetical protein
VLVVLRGGRRDPRWEEKGRGKEFVKRKEDTPNRDKEQKQVMMAAVGCANGFGSFLFFPCHDQLPCFVYPLIW